MNRKVADSIMLIGKLGSAPESKPTANGQMLILNLGVQVVSFAPEENGQSRSTERTRWHRVVSFNPRVIRRAQELEKGDIVTVSGYLDQRTYEMDGQSRFITEFVAEELDPLRTKQLPLAIPSPPLGEARLEKRADMLRITVELLPGGRESGAMVIGRGEVPIANLAGLTKTIGAFGK